MLHIFYSNWESLLRGFVITVLGYAALVFLIRMSGKRTLAKMDAFDFIVTIALGSCLASLSLNKNITLADGVVVYFTLIGLQFLITWLSVRFKKVKTIVSGQPTLLLYNGQLLEKVMKKERITREEIFVSARASGIAELNEIEVVILETTGDIIVIAKSETTNRPLETLKDVAKYPPDSDRTIQSNNTTKERKFTSL